MTALSSKLAEVLAAQYRQHPNWSYQLHSDNLAVLAEQQPELGLVPSYVSVLRFMKSHGLFKRPRRGPVHSLGARQAELRFENREVRSYECEYVHGLWHLDFHDGSLRVLLPNGQWFYPILLGVLDDHSRLCCHAQWYLAEGAEELCHGLSQGFLKRQLPRSLLFDNGSPRRYLDLIHRTSRRCLPGSHPAATQRQRFGSGPLGNEHRLIQPCCGNGSFALGTSASDFGPNGSARLDSALA